VRVTPQEQPIYSLRIDEVYGAGGTSAGGLSAAEAEARLNKLGPNAIQTIKGTPLWKKFLANFTHLMALLLWAGGAMAFIGQMPQLGWAIWAVIVINAVFSFWQEFKAERATEALKELLPTYAHVVRDGQEQKILAEELVPGDVILLSEGDHISADARLVEESELRVNLSTLNGESVPARRTAEAVLRPDLTIAERPNLVFAGTSVTAGTGKAVAFATGMNTEFGKIAQLTQSVGEELSPLQKEVNQLTKVVTILAVGADFGVQGRLFQQPFPSGGYSGRINHDQHPDLHSAVSDDFRARAVASAILVILVHVSADYVPG
jgi:magnesium-transporting ATPase (P-type)